MADIDFELISPSAAQANDAVLVRRGAAAPNTGALILTADMLARANHTGTQTASTISDFSTAVAATPSVTANTAKVSNATHTGDVTGATALTVANNAVTNAKAADMATGTIKGRATAGAGDPEDLTGAQATALLVVFGSGAKGLVPASGGGTTNFLRADGTFAEPPGGGGAPTESIIIAVSDELTALVAGIGKVTFRMPYAFTLTGIRASLRTAQTSGSILTVDVNKDGISILSTKITIDNTEKTSITAATPAVISDGALADDAEITIDIDQIGNGTAIGLKVYLIGHQ